MILISSVVLSPNNKYNLFQDRMYQTGIWHLVSVEEYECYHMIITLHCPHKALKEHLQADCHCIKLAGWVCGAVTRSLLGTQVKWSHYIVSARQLITVFLLVITIPLQADSGDWKWSPVCADGSVCILKPTMKRCDPHSSGLRVKVLVKHHKV